MNAAERFLDTNVLLYLLSADQAKADRAERELLAGGIVSVQVLNEFASVSLGKLGMSIAETGEALATIRAVCPVVPVIESVHDAGMRLADTLGVSVYDAMILASALLAGCRTLVTEDLQHGQVVDGRLRIHNPFR